jgi:hypothetical protein
MDADVRGWAERDFEKARARARSSVLLSLLKPGKDDLLSFEDVRRIVAPTGECYIGCRTVPVAQIVGSEGRARDFNSSFCPRREFMRERWVRVDAAYYEEKALPAVKLLEIGGLYFVRDGNHRVSVARAHGVAFVDAEVTRLRAKVALHSPAAIDSLRERVRARGEIAAAA